MRLIYFIRGGGKWRKIPFPIRVINMRPTSVWAYNHLQSKSHRFSLFSLYFLSLNKIWIEFSQWKWPWSCLQQVACTFALFAIKQKYKERKKKQLFPYILSSEMAIFFSSLFACVVFVPIHIILVKCTNKRFFMQTLPYTTLIFFCLILALLLNQFSRVTGRSIQIH